jgi:hypothetical protein
MRVMMGIVLACGLALGGLLQLVEPYRRDWQAEQQSLVEIRAEGRTVGTATQPVGPAWLRKLARPAGRARYFDRVSILTFIACDFRLSAPLRAAFKHLQGITWQDH